MRDTRRALNETRDALTATQGELAQTNQELQNTRESLQTANVNLSGIGVLLIVGMVVVIATSAAMQVALYRKLRPKGES